VQLAISRNVADLPLSFDRFLEARVERNVQASLLVHARAGRLGHADPLFAWAHSDEGEIAFFSMRTPPWPMLVSELDEPCAGALMDVWLEHDPAPPGVTGQPQSTRVVATAWERRTGGRAHCRMREAMHMLREVTDPPRPPSGALRVAAAGDRELLVAWERAFVSEAGLIADAAEQAKDTVARRLDARAQLVWEDRQPVSTLSLSPAIAGTVRVGPVYTPPEHRRHGYATAAVARACRDVLESGARQCMLFTDLANPTSNKIYASVGFRRVGDWEELEFSR
jgi:predicted GNAT family acetyltransferase